MKTASNNKNAKMDDKGALAVTICNEGQVSCCSTGMLDNPDKNDFELGKVDTFNENLLGSCSGFKMNVVKSVKVINKVM